MPTTNKTDPTQITFKLDDEYFRPLAKEAKAKGVSPNIAAREHVIRGVTGDRSEIFALRDEVSALHSELSQLRDLLAATLASRSAERSQPSEDVNQLQLSIATGFGAVLAELRPQASQDEITEWVKKNLLRKGL